MAERSNSDVYKAVERLSQKTSDMGLTLSRAVDKLDENTRALVRLQAIQETQTHQLEAVQANQNGMISMAQAHTERINAIERRCAERLATGAKRDQKISDEFKRIGSRIADVNTAVRETTGKHRLSDLERKTRQDTVWKLLKYSGAVIIALVSLFLATLQVIELLNK